MKWSDLLVGKKEIQTGLDGARVGLRDKPGVGTRGNKGLHFRKPSTSAQARDKNLKVQVVIIFPRPWVSSSLK